MKVNATTNPIVCTTFKGTREDRNTVLQLTRNNTYSLTDPNQRRINEAIDNLAKQRGEENIQFLLNVGRDIKYDTNFATGIHNKKNDWKNRLKGAAEKSLSASEPELKEKYQPEIDSVFGTRPLSQDEKDIQKYQSDLIETVGEDEHADKIKKDLDYFVSSTETSIAQKKYILERLNYFMSPEYQINPQLKDKKPQILSEIVNDISVNTQDSEVPNIKAVNQKMHGMCAAISITRKAIAYEDKANYVDSLLSELDDTDKVMVYDIQNLGSGKRIPVDKVYIDFDYAQERGYRIVDASTMQWMNIANMYGVQNENLYNYTPFDKYNFDAFQDLFFSKTISDPSLISKQAYYQALVKTKQTLQGLKSSKIKTEVKKTEERRDYDSNLRLIGAYTDELRSSIREILPEESKDSVQRISKDLIRLQQPYSQDIDRNREDLREVSYIPNEELSQKKLKVEKYFNRYMDTTAINEDAISQNSGKIVDLVSSIHDIDSKLNPKHTIRSDFLRARQLYKAESLYRTSKLLGFCEEDCAAERMVEYNIPDRETRMINGFNRVIDGIKENDRTILTHFSRITGIPEENKDEIIERLEESKKSVESTVTDFHDFVYHSMGLGSRAYFVSNCIDRAITQIEGGDTKELKESAKRLNVKNDKKTVIKEYNTLLERLENPEDNDAIVDAFNKLGIKDQSSLIVDLFNHFGKNFSLDNPNRDYHFSIFKQNLGLDENAPEEDVIKHFDNIARDINTMCQAMQLNEDALDVPNENGETYFTTKGYKLLAKRAESDGDLISDKTMRKLQERFAKVDKLRSSDEFQSRQGKISQPELYRFSPEEKAALKQIDKNLNRMYSEITRELNKQYRDIKEPLKKHAMYIGTNAGEYWTLFEGHQGLYTPQEVKIFEQITDRPYYAERDINVAVDKIKNGTHSGVSGSSVFHDEIGGHGQYVADIKPINGKDALMHDNSWGASEHENIWTDSEGVQRTDYSDHRGGDIGYITDDDYRNGNYVSNLTHKKGHVNPDIVNNRLYNKLNPEAKDGHDFALVWDILLCGEDPNNRSIAGGLRDTIYVPDSLYIGTIQTCASKMTKKEIQKAIFRIQSAGEAYRGKYKKIMERVEGKDFLNKGITSQEEYDALDDNDMLKVAFEKTALRYAYDDCDIIKDLPNAKTLKDLEKYKEQQRKEAFENFEYAFGKTLDVLEYPSRYTKDLVKALTKALNDNGVQYQPERLADMVRGISVLSTKEEKQCTGSVRDTINLVIEKADRQFSEVLPESEASNKAKEQYLSDLRKVFEDNMYFNEDDLNADSEKAKGIRNWIDRKFNPQSNEEFVQIYRNLQDLTIEEFEKIADDVTDRELGISSQTGYDILVKVKASNSMAKRMLMNTLFYDEYAKDINRSETTPSYKFEKHEVKHRGAYYLGRNFDDIYRDMYLACSSLEYEKAFNKYKDFGVRRYNALPSYPKISIFDDAKVTVTTNSIQDTFGNAIAEINTNKNCIFDIKIVDLLNKYRAQIPEGRPLTNEENKVMSELLTLFVKYNAHDPSMNYILENAYNALELKEGATISDYNQYLDSISDNVDSLKKINTTEDFESNIENAVKYLETIQKYTINEIAPRYRKSVSDDLSSIMSLMREGIEFNGLDEYKDAFDIIQKLEETSSDDSDFKQKIEMFFMLVSHIEQTKTLKHSNEKQYNVQLAQANAFADDFVEQCIRTDEQKNVRANIRDYINRELSSDKKQSADDALSYAIEKFKHDFKRGHFASNPTMLLDTFLVESASDAVHPEGSKYLEGMEATLTNQLELAQLIDVQDLLIDAVNTGNPSQVTKYFEDYNGYSPITGEKINMNSDESIDTMVKTLLIRNNTETAKMFIEKLGLGDRFTKIEQDLLDKSKIKEKIDELGDMLRKHNELCDIISEETENLANRIDTSGKPATEILRAKHAISKKAKPLFVQSADGNLRDVDKKKNSRLQKDINFYFKALSNADAYIKEHPDLSKSDAVKQAMAQALADMAGIANERMEETQNYVKSVFDIYRFIENLNLPEYSEGAKTQKELSEDFSEIAKYNREVLNKSSGKHSQIKYSKFSN